MFDFTTTTLISSLAEIKKVTYPATSDADYKTKMRTEKNKIKDAKVAFISEGYPRGLQVVGGPVLYVDNVGLPMTECKAYFRKFSLPKVDEAEFTLPDTMTPGSYRLYFDIIAPNSMDMELMSTVEQFPHKEYAVPFTLPEGKESYTPTEVIAVIKDSLDKRSEKFIDYPMVEFGEDDAPKFTILATKATRRFRKAELQSFDAVPTGGCSTTCVEDFIPVVVAEVTPGDAGFGTYEYMVANYRLPSAYYNKAYPLMADERPVVGVNYDQYTVHMTTSGRKIGHEIVGGLNTSFTTHVFFVAAGEASTAFAEALSYIGIGVEEVKDADTVPVDGSPDPLA